MTASSKRWNGNMINLKSFLTALHAKGIHLFVEQGKLKSKADPGAITAEIGQQIKTHKLDIIRLLEQDNTSTSVQIGPRPPAEDCPLSFSQQRLWLLDRIDGGGSHYNMPAALKLTGVLNMAALEQAFATIVSRHESLRTCFGESADGQPTQYVKAADPFKVTFVDLSTLDESQQSAQVDSLVSQYIGKIFDLGSDLMMRVGVVKLKQNQHILLVVMHHIASDGWSMGVVIKEFITLYTAYAANKPNPLSPLAIQYGDYAYWQRNWLQGEVLDKQLSYWTEQLADVPVVHSLPLDYPRPAIQTFGGTSRTTRVSKQTSDALNKLCQEQGISLYMGIHAAYCVLLSRYSNETDIVIGSPIANREQAEVVPLIGFFTNTLILRSNLADNPDFITMLQRSKQMLLDAYAHQQVPFEQIVEKLQPQRSLSHLPLFQLWLGLAGKDEDTGPQIPGIELSPVKQPSDIAKYDLTLNVGERDYGLLLSWEYNTSLFTQQTIVRMGDHFARLLNALVSEPQQKVFSAPLLDDAELQQLTQWNETALEHELEHGLEHDRDKTLNVLFAEQVAAHAQSIAVEYQDTRLSYQQLDNKANQLANFFIETGIEPGVCVGIYLERSIEMVIAVLAVIKSGATYVPLEPDYPIQRTKMILEDAEVELVLVNTASMQSLPMEGIDVLLMDNAATDDQWLAEFPTHIDEDEQPQLTPDSIAYILYTSGSTGRPKGVMVPHRGVANYLLHTTKNYLQDSIHGSVVSSPLCFDATLTTLLTPLFAGKTMHLVADNDNTLSLLAERLFDVEEPWLFKITPAHLEALSHLADKNKVCSAHHKIVVGGEQLTYKILALFRDQLLPNATFINEYGPTETVVGCSVYTLLPNNEQSSAETEAVAVPIGKPIGNTRLYVMSAAMQLQPVNSVGELYIGGEGVALGYLNRDDLTADSFITHPTNVDERLYRTGDLVRWMTNGELEFIGRVDHQVKIRGFRIELGEIENVLQHHDDIRDAVVLARNDDGEETQLVAYVVPMEYPQHDDHTALIKAKQTLGKAYLETLVNVLPEYMVPSLCVLLDSMPLTTNGKIDTKALPAPKDSDLQQQEYVAPRNDIEQGLCQLWQALLKIEQVGITDNFFALGGHSLSATRLIAQVNQQFELTLSLQIIFSQQTVEDLSQHITQQLMMKKLSSGDVDIDELNDEELDLYLAMLPEE
jgi:amino acid adenylation domain-containing protein